MFFKYKPVIINAADEEEDVVCISVCPRSSSSIRFTSGGSSEPLSSQLMAALPSVLPVRLQHGNHGDADEVNESSQT